ncbi:DNA cytosine methyltransferase [Trichlorobacter ammonificans]|uniref:Cytosine-specific methyltransferase n=1 Tax=Trichlorobacter ammonificans TaxID=2916410 RepID=A0ABN8HF94_9BACT|nr:DNA cytosine methyltransferase [Trichlorobacter ammonificans]CAH2031503.1 Cytosine-specific methyltransferase [Trichlorobacter ammonificans]
MTAYKKRINNQDDIPIIAEEETVYHARIGGKLLENRYQPKLIDLFAGAGGMTLGFTKLTGHSFQPVWANDFNEYAAKTYNANFGNHCTVGDIVDILQTPKTVIPQADVVIGGPPCQGFSLLNKYRDGDPRKQLWRPFMDIVERSGASVFVMENVPQLLESFEHGEIVEIARAMGFKIRWAKLCAADYGVPQVRWRAFIVGCKFADPAAVFPPKKTNFNPNNGYRKAFSEEFDSYIATPAPWKTVRDAIGNLPAPEGVEIRDEPSPLDIHFGRTPTALSIERYKSIPEEGMNRFDLQRRAPQLTPACWIRKTSGGTDLFGRLWWDRPSVTIRTEFFKPEKGRYLHPVQHRPITHREAARLQSFPDDFKFLGTKTEIARQIGNAVPPQLAARIADCVYTLIISKGASECRTSSARKKEAGLCPEYREAIQSLR